MNYVLHGICVVLLCFCEMLVVYGKHWLVIANLMPGFSKPNK